MTYIDSKRLCDYRAARVNWIHCWTGEGSFEKRNAFTAARNAAYGELMWWRSDLDKWRYNTNWVIEWASQAREGDG